MAVMEPTHRGVAVSAMSCTAPWTIPQFYNGGTLGLKDSLDLHTARRTSKRFCKNADADKFSAGTIYEIIPAGTPEKGHL